MEDFLKIVGVAFLIMLAIFAIAVLGGTLVWLTWPVAIPAAFPGLVASGTLAAALSWKQSVCLTWLAGCLVKSTHTSSSKSK